jgi:hypothetical protein
MLSVYIKSNINAETIVGAIPTKYPIYVIDHFSDQRTYQVESKKKMITKMSTSYHGLLLISKDGVNPLKNYASVSINRNFYPRNLEDETTVYAAMKHWEKEEADRLLKLFSLASGENPPKYVPKNGFGFYQFESSDLVPVILGMLRSFPSIEGARFNYARKQQK